MKIISIILIIGLPILCSAQAPKITVTKITKIETSYPSWSPDGKSIVCQSNRNDDNSEIYITNDRGTGIKRLTFNTGNDEYPVFSLDGTKISFVSEKDGDQEVYLMNADGSGQVNVTNSSSKEIHPQFSRDGRKIIFNSDRLGNMDIFTVDLQTKMVEQLSTSPHNDTYAHWSPVSDEVVFAKWMRDDKGVVNTEVFLLDVSTKQETRLTNHAGFDGWPTWSGDGKFILFGSNRENGKDFDIYRMNRDGSEMTKLTNGSAEGASFTKPVVARDGSSRVICTRTKEGNVEVFILLLAP